MKIRYLLVGLILSTATNANDFDKRTPVALSEQGVAMVLTEMREMLAGTQGILKFLAQKDAKGVQEEAGKLGKHMAHQVEKTKLMESLPMEFKKLGMSVHADFDDIAAAAGAAKFDSGAVLTQLATAMNKCVACHESYRLVVKSAP